MELNKIQKQIYEEYQRKGRVWAECPRQSGKTELLSRIAIEEIEKGKTIFIKSPTLRMRYSLLRKIEAMLAHEFERYSWRIADTEELADVILYDEIYYDLLSVMHRKNKKDVKIVCLRTPMHKTLRFNYTQLPGRHQEWIKHMRNSMCENEFEIEFGVNR